MLLEMLLEVDLVVLDLLLLLLLLPTVCKGVREWRVLRRVDGADLDAARVLMELDGVR